MKKKIINSIAVCLLLAFSLIVTPACSLFDKGKVEVNKTTSTQGGNPNTPNSNYSNFLSSIASTKEYTGSYKSALTFSKKVDTYNYLDYVNFEYEHSIVTNGFTLLNYLDAENGAYYYTIGNVNLINTHELYAETIFTNIKTSDEEDAENFYIERVYDGNQNNVYKTQKTRALKYALAEATPLHYLPEFDKTRADNNTSIVGTREYSLDYMLNAYVQTLSVTNENIASSSLDYNYLNPNATDFKVDISMPESTDYSIIQFTISTNYQNDNSAEEKYNNYNITSKIYCQNGKVVKLTLNYNLNQCENGNSKNFIKQKYDKVINVTIEQNIEYLTSWNTTSEDYANIFASHLTEENISDYRNSKDSLPTTINNFYINVDGKTVKTYSNFNEETQLLTATILAENSNQPAMVMDPTTRTISDSTIGVEFYYDKEFKQKVLEGVGLYTCGYDKTIYGKIIVPNEKCVILVNEYTKTNDNLANYYEKTNQLNKTFISTDMPIINTITDTYYEYDYYSLEREYNSLGYSTTIYINSTKNTTNQPLNLKKNRLIYLDIYLTKTN